MRGSEYSYKFATYALPWVYNTNVVGVVWTCVHIHTHIKKYVHVHICICTFVYNSFRK